MPADPPQPLELARVARELVMREGGEGTSAQVAAGTVGAWKKLSQHLSPLVGDAGVWALVDRSLTLTRAVFPWLAGDVESMARNPPWIQLRDGLEQQDRDVAIEASVALLATFLKLLGKFIGETLALRLVHEVWPELALSTQKEST